MSKSVFYHAASPACVSAKERLRGIYDRPKYDMEVVSIGQESGRIAEAESAGVESVDAAITGADEVHINFGCRLEDL